MNKSIYISRPILNSGDLRAWARSQGFTSFLNEDALHVTVAFDRREHDWDALPLQGPREIKVLDPDERSVAIFRGGAVVLEIYSTELTTRWAELIQSGLYWRWDDYRPHITFTYCVPKGFKTSRIQPYAGVIHLGAEEIIEVSSDWTSRLIEHPL